MNEQVPAACPRCGSSRLIAHTASRKVFIDRNGKSVPPLTATRCLINPVVEKTSTVYICACSWVGTANELRQEG